VEARNRLGIPADAFSFLAIGFIQPHKGFDRAVRAFAQVGVPGCRLDIVGSVRVEEPAYLDHLDELERLAAATPGVTVHAGFVTDEAFDAWLVAADVVVLPYRHIWSSGVLERAALYERPVIASRVGGLAAQARGDTVLVDDDAQLASAMRAAAARARPATADDPWPHGTADRERVQSEIRARAARERGGLSSGAATGIVRDPVTPLARVAPLALPEPRSLNPVSAAIKRLVRRATAWEVEPIVEQVNRLRTAAIEAAERSRSADR
jgi:glycosyltransferase involved in cell wall biosynthesis